MVCICRHDDVILGVASVLTDRYCGEGAEDFLLCPRNCLLQHLCTCSSGHTLLESHNAFMSSRLSKMHGFVFCMFFRCMYANILHEICLKADWVVNLCSPLFSLCFPPTLPTLPPSLQCRLIISQMSDQPCQLLNPLFLPLLLSLSLSFLYQHIELNILWTYFFISLTAHLHYGVSVVSAWERERDSSKFCFNWPVRFLKTLSEQVQQLCSHFNIYCFSLQKKPQ